MESITKKLIEKREKPNNIISNNTISNNNLSISNYIKKIGNSLFGDVLKCTVNNEERENEGKEEEIKINELNSNLIDAKKENIILKNKIKEMKNLYNKIKIDNNVLKEALIKKEYELKKIKSKLGFELLDEEKLYIIILISDDENINYSILCKNTDKFSRIEELLKDIPNI